MKDRFTLSDERRERSKRDAFVAHLRENQGKTFVAIGKLIGVSYKRVREIYQRAVRARRAFDNRHSNPFYGLSVRAMNILDNANINNREALESTLKSGSIPRYRGLGKVTYLEYCALLGIPADESEKLWSQRQKR
jgi:hypothetical protein